MIFLPETHSIHTHDVHCFVRVFLCECVSVCWFLLLQFWSFSCIYIFTLNVLLELRDFSFSECLYGLLMFCCCCCCFFFCSTFLCIYFICTHVHTVGSTAYVSVSSSTKYRLIVCFSSWFVFLGVTMRTYFYDAHMYYEQQEKRCFRP